MGNLFINVLEASLLCSVIILLIFAVSPVLKHRRTVFWRYVLWIALGVRLVLPFDFSVAEPAVTIPVFPAGQSENASSDEIIDEDFFDEETELDNVISEGMDEQITDNVFDKNQTMESSALLETENAVVPMETELEDSTGNKFKLLNLVQKLDLYTFLSIIWAFGCVVMVVFQWLAYWHFKKDLKQKKRYLFDKDNISVYASPMISSPMLFGILKPQIYLPEKEYSEEELSFVLKHEWTHYKRKDLWLKLLLAAARTIHWFNPLIYWMEKQAGKDMELLCDSQAVQELSKEEKKKYSEMLLACASERKNSHFRVIFSSEFAEDAKTLKERFANIFADGKRRKGIVIAAIGICAIVAVSVFVAFGSSGHGVSENGTADEENSAGADNSTGLSETSISEETSIINILIIGDDSMNEEYGHADSIMVLTVNKEMERIVLTSFLRDIYVTIPENGEGTLSDSYQIGGGKLLAETLKENFSVVVHGFIRCDYEGFEKAIDALGGVEIQLTSGEAESLNSTLYISEEENRNLEKGIQTLNGNQALGYVRIRSTQDFEGQSGDFARTSRQRRILQTVFEKCKNTDWDTLQEILNEITPYSEMTMFYDGYDTFWEDAYQLIKKVEPVTFCVPMESTYSSETINGKSVLSVDFETIKDAMDQELAGDGWDRREYLFQIDGWQYYLEEDGNKESRINEFADVLEPLLLVRYKSGNREVLEDLIIEDFAKECPVLLMEKAGRIIYKAAPTADVIGVKGPVMVSIAIDGSDRRTADTMLYHHFENVCEDNGWIYYSGWTNDREYPRPLCRIAPDFVGGPQYVTDLPGILCGVYDNYAFYLASSEVTKPGMYKLNLTTGETIIHDKWDVYADEIAYFHAREKLYPAGELRDVETPGVNIRWAFEYGEEVHSFIVPLYTEH